MLVRVAVIDGSLCELVAAAGDVCPFEPVEVPDALLERWRAARREATAAAVAVLRAVPEDDLVRLMFAGTVRVEPPARRRPLLVWKGL